jgi:hypothetical protein
VNRFVRSAGYVRVRALTGTVFFLMGVAIVVRTAMTVGIGLSSFAPLLMGAALMGLGALRWRDYLRLRKGPA